MDIVISNIPKEKQVDLQRWADIVIEKWQFAISKYKLVNTAKLINSFYASVNAEAEGNVAVISFVFERYLRYLDMGVGKGVRLDERDSGSNRKKYPVYNKIFYAEMNRLSELLSNFYMQTTQKTIVYGMD